MVKTMDEPRKAKIRGSMFTFQQKKIKNLAYFLRSKNPTQGYLKAVYISNQGGPETIEARNKA